MDKLKVALIGGGKWAATTTGIYIGQGAISPIASGLNLGAETSASIGGGIADVAFATRHALGAVWNLPGAMLGKGLKTFGLGGKFFDDSIKGYENNKLRVKNRLFDVKGRVGDIANNTRLGCIAAGSSIISAPFGIVDKVLGTNIAGKVDRKAIEMAGRPGIIS